MSRCPTEATSPGEIVGWSTTNTGQRHTILVFLAGAAFMTRAFRRGQMRLVLNNLEYELAVLELAPRPVRREQLSPPDVGPAGEAAGIAKPARIYDLRSTFASKWLAAGITTFELARIMGTSVGMIEAHYGALIDTANDSILARVEGLGHVRATAEAPDA
jgi:hypothetical protein